MEQNEKKEIENTSSNCFTQQMEEQNCLCSEIMFTSEIGIIIFKNQEEKAIFWNENAISILSNFIEENFNTNLCNLFNLPEKEKEQSGYLKKNGIIVEYNIYQTKHFKWVFLKDITEKERLKTIAREANYMENLTNIFSSIRHEIANPLVTANITLSVLKNKLINSSQNEYIKYIDRIEKSLNRIDKLVSSLKSFSLFNEFETEPIEVNEFLKEESNLLQPYFDEKNIDFYLETFPETLFIKGNIGALRQILLNLIFNAVDAMQNIEQPQIEVKTVKTGKTILIKISNNGEKIPEDKIDKLFTPFFTTKSKGTGLGLAIVKKFTGLMNGNISVKSTEKKTTFTLEFPEYNSNPEASN